MNIKMILFLTFTMGFGLSAQTVSLKGKVTNQSGKAISGAIVTLKSKQLADTTDASGAFSMIGGTAAVISASPVPSGMEAVSMKNGSVLINLSKPEAIRVELFDMQGNLLERALDNSATAGNYRFDVIKRQLAANMMVVRVSIGQSAVNFRYLPLVNGHQAFTSSVATSTGGVLAKLQATADSLQVSASRYAAKTVKINSYDTTVDISLDTVICKANPSKTSSATVSGSGPHKVVIETNSDAGIKSGTIYRPADLGAGKNYPIFVWGEGACAQDGLSNKSSMGEIASWGYFIVADGSSSGGGGTADALIAYITWAIAENRNPCSAYYQSLDTSKIAADGFSCGGLMAENAAGDPRFTAVGISSSGLFNADANVYKKIHTPFKILLGSAGMAYSNGVRDYDEISKLGIPILFLSKKGADHGGDLGNGKGDFNTVNLAWLNWQLKGDTGVTGKGLLVGPDCKYCKSSGWEFKSKNLP